MRYALMRPVRVDLETFARDAHVHPELIRRFVALGIIDADRDVSGGLWFSREQLAVLARVQRLRAGFSLNYAAVGLVCDLLDRIAALEAAQRHRAHQRSGGRSWT
ncbi:chaperone modulator CbpM [Actinoallomurus rhizosphaericola]|uniref:chaperone modulator CbpM n=1 Tax=Actinoallomurus rhizosphaericola TaxID=2952536 RepID=UPI0020920B80|nr:chaperone modulator CbpM [Actinoallomurus rhizosphaericola]MCO5995712.1 chaperone modulator CbpM [Actinoallomurus rhizosphaericola]